MNEREQILALAGEPIGFVSEEVVQSLKKGARWGAARISPTLDDEYPDLISPIYGPDQLLAARKPLEEEVERLKVGYTRELDAVSMRNYDLRQQLAEAQAVPDGFVEVMAAVFREIEAIGEHGKGNAPGHCHEVPGVWDGDNGQLAGQPCAWCALWNKASAIQAERGGSS
ncbi:hypothetical protein [Pseudomonas sp.]|uniref:hypothetical protein n=1 Tax=Pseudomonas sp. TaxID=306 RepID=UPI003F3EAD8E